MTSHQPTTIYWLSRDLRLNDNPALNEAVKSKQPILFLYIEDETCPHPMGGASQWWLRASLISFSQTLASKNTEILFAKGDPLKIIPDLAKKENANTVLWNADFTPHNLNLYEKLLAKLKAQKVSAQYFNGSLLFLPWEHKNKSGNFYKVFTPFWKNLQTMPVRGLYSKPKNWLAHNITSGLSIDDIVPLPEIRWYDGLAHSFQPGETNAQRVFQEFIDKKIAEYKNLRDFPALDYTSRLSAPLHFGEISPVQIWHAVIKTQDEAPEIYNQCHHFLSELAWREFSYHLLYYFPALPSQPFKEAFASFPWKRDQSTLNAWQQGLTGYPLVDAGMRELWHTGYMHNRVRMVVASFLIKHLMLPWQEGEAWFWDTLVDADLANNSASWQWVAGCGADAAPYFRIFNPILQSEKFDKDGAYIRKWVPELKLLSSRYIHSPWLAPIEILNEAKIKLGANYPHPLVEHDSARKAALAAYQEIKKGN